MGGHPIHLDSQIQVLTHCWDSVCHQMSLLYLTLVYPQRQVVQHSWGMVRHQILALHWIHLCHPILIHHLLHLTNRNVIIPPLLYFCPGHYWPDSYALSIRASSTTERLHTLSKLFCSHQHLSSCLPQALVTCT